MFEFKINIDEKEHDQFVRESKYCNLLQSSSWASIKQNWKHEIVGVYEDSRLVASSLVLIKELPLSFTMMYIPRGPVMDFENEELVSFYFKNLKKWAKKHHCLFIKMDPSIHYCDYHLEDEKKVYPESEKIMKILEKNGCIHMGLTDDFHATIQPRIHMAVYKNEFSVDQFTKKGKKNLKIALKKHLEIKMGSYELLDDFCRVMNCTSQKKGISLRNKEYFKLLLDTYSEDAFIMLAYLDLEKTYKESKTRFDQVLKDIALCPAHAKKKRFQLEETLESLTRECDELKNFMSQYGNTVCVCGTLTVQFGKTSEILYAGSDNQFRRYMAPYLTWTKTMEECFNRECEFSNMGGVEGTLKGGLADFKAVFHPVVNEFIGEYDIPISRLLYRISKFFYKKRKG
ncbi:peptidoglycan bridge formation glycyltransferase FemA/FemB family protein [Floccifex sp.]|uniref:peptidoglycan bridge formation glycyltransferase FemA/FemB family protein n=1 Tax=Floccifex sp. TaxID=2815810 RepID=UPI003F025E0F